MSEQAQCTNEDAPSQCLKRSALRQPLTSWNVFDFFFPTDPPPPSPLPPNASVTRRLTENISGALSAAHPPSRLESEPGGVPPVPAQRAEGPHDQFEARVVYVPQVDVFVRDLHGALSVDVQVWGGHQVHVETFWKTM